MLQVMVFECCAADGWTVGVFISKKRGIVSLDMRERGDTAVCKFTWIYP
jgi:hypothetical protein